MGMPQIRVSDEVYDRLQTLQRPGQSFDGVLRERLLGSANDVRELVIALDEEGAEATRRQLEQAAEMLKETTNE